MTAGPQQTTARDANQREAWHRLSPRMLLVHPVQELIRSFPVLLGVFFAGASNGHGSWSGLVVAGIVTLLSLTRWFTTTLRITPAQVQLRQGLIRRRTLSTARDRIRTVDVTAHPLHRALGLARVVVGTGSNDRKGSGRVILDGLPRAHAEQLRDQLLHHAEAPTLAGNATADKSSALSSGAELLRLDPRWIRLAPFTLSGVATGLVLWGLFWRLRGESGVDITRWSPVHRALDWLHGLPTATEVAVVAVAAIAFVAFTSTIGYVLLFWNFRLVRLPGDALQVTRGLLTARSTTIERRRLVGVEITEPLLLRSVGGARALTVATGLRTGRGAERGGEVLVPPAPIGVVTAAAAEVLAGTAAITTPLVPHGRNALRRRMIRTVGTALLIVTGAGVLAALGGPGWPLVAAAALLLAAVPLARDRYRSLGHARAAGFVVTRSGSLVRRRALLAESAIVGVTIRRTLFQRRAGLASVTFTTAAGKQGYTVSDVDAVAAVQLADAGLAGLVSRTAAATS